ncbi:peptidoglycan-binding protein [Oscillatoria sp. CS-180]|uniref:peptidoglycan-binding protein n=1 Tax=Oscillatoria sp. CS-180 TaxID=3021720 RepID=UPI0023306925|nr:peptidoglycan-binding protein [Oscillatoria sp. CS-180]MDB9525270.1 peptidoglycan-binding protein [Oscillatoria sp. CS-180]
MSKMSHRFLLTLLTVVATAGTGSSAIATDFQSSGNGVHFAQDTGNDADLSEEPKSQPAQPQPSPMVQALQSRLAELGYYSGTVNGIFNTDTQRAIAAFQQDNGLVATGILDPKTRERLTNPNPVQTPFETGPETPDPATELPQPEAANNPLTDNSEPVEVSPAPVDTAPEALVESGSADALIEGIETPAATSPEEESGVPIPSEGTPPEEIELFPSETETPAADAEASEGLLPSILWGLVIMTIGTVGTGLILWLAKRGQSQEPQPQGPLSAPDDRLRSQTPSSVSAKSISPLSSKHSWNGQPEPKDVSSASVSAVSLSEPAEARLAKINIVDELIRDLEKPDPEVRRKAIWELGQRGNSVAVQPLMSLLLEADSSEQSLILASLSEISMKTLKPMNRAVALALRDDNPEVRKNAIRDLTRIYDSLGQISRLLGQATADSDPDVRQTAHWALDQLNHMRLSANDSAGLLGDRSSSVEKLPEDGSSSHKV